MCNAELMPREKLLAYGAESLTDQELLAIFLRTGIKGLPVMQLSETVLKQFGSLRGLLSADVNAFCQMKGLGQTQFIQLQASKEMTKRYLAQQMQVRENITEPYLAVMCFQTELESEEREVFMVMFLDNQNRLIKKEKMFYGTINQATVYPREIIKEALKCNAAAIIVAHNHPSGLCTPSESDRILTKKIEMACDLVEIRFVDHIVVGKGDYFSFEEEKFRRNNS
ncbi:DNA repair protein RadC [Actinobacillus equuli subsp. equuli]|uniref:DNA repair protein RadC n=1 Tax=Actinobacillus equuli subsp. equuli TaxID=202947 RepID=A0A9X4G315_ACTEU|nr:DNA repair protein RadC [Actinobacillus equuli]MDE8034411.1 DNA repair protein RadC [Actinobacillus equuli subsp. equuli]MDG4947458.1 DNA repair protein RadC [Actinobacillus equuli subsp. haemolyticus]